MKPSLRRVSLAACAVALASAFATLAWPPGTVEAPIASDWNQPAGMTFAPDGHLYVWEKSGLVWIVHDGVKHSEPLIDISEEVGNWRDHGLLGFALDPQFEANGYIYLLYAVDYHHLIHFGTPQYDPQADEYFIDTIARVTRYTCNASDNFHSVDPGSRTILIGNAIVNGMPLCHQSHGPGSLVFGEDGTLLVSCGDAASYETVDDGGPINGSSNTALADGILQPKEDVGAYRAQLVDSLNGKILRIDPATGDGVPSNPFYDPLAPRAARSRVWALGLRNPFRMALVPGSGSHFPQDADPGTLYIGDVGWNSREELSVCDGPGQNFGWPLYEGLSLQSGYASSIPANLDAPNPLAGGGCNAFFTFGDLLVQDTLAQSSWPNPCDTAQQIPSSIPRFEQVRPLIDWHHGGTSARTKIYIGDAAANIPIDDPSSPIISGQFSGSCAVACTWFPSDYLGPSFAGTLIFGDYTSSWLNALTFDTQGDPTSVIQLASPGEAASIVAAAYDPTTDGFYFIQYSDQGVSEVLRLSSTSDLPPIVIASASPTYGPTPLGVQFTGSGSFDPEGTLVTYSWDFGDEDTSTEADPFHVFSSPEDVTAQGTFVARILSLVPPTPMGGGNWDPEVMRDGVFPAVGSTNSLEQYDTFHQGHQGSDDWIGYTFSTPRLFRSLAFQEGRHFTDGGWFDTFAVEVENAGVWTSVTGLALTPSYPGNNGITYETFQVDFDPTVGTGIRMRGDPGGSNGFISVGELRVIASAGGGGQPLQLDVRLTVVDGAGKFAHEDLIVSLDNTPPVVQITSPLDGSLYTFSGNTTVPLEAVISDAEHGPGELGCAWETILFHDEHNHPEPPDANCSTTSVLTPIGCDGHTYYYGFRLTVTDAAGLATTQIAYVYPDCCSIPPTIYCSAKTNSQGCVPAITTTGVPRASQTSGFVISCSELLNKKNGLLLYGLDGRAAFPFQGGTLCVQPPLERTFLQSSGGSTPPVADCSGVFSIDFLAYAHGLLGGNPPAALLVPGTPVQAQWWGRDPAFAPPDNSQLSAGVEFVICE